MSPEDKAAVAAAMKAHSRSSDAEKERAALSRESVS
jgi:hypothetical protein